MLMKVFFFLFSLCNMREIQGAWNSPFPISLGISHSALALSLLEFLKAREKLLSSFCW